MDWVITYIIGVSIGLYCGICIFANSGWENRLIEAELAEFVVDSTTGDTTFIIYAEQETK